MLTARRRTTGISSVAILALAVAIALMVARKPSELSSEPTYEGSYTIMVLFDTARVGPSFELSRLDVITVGKFSPPQPAPERTLKWSRKGVTGYLYKASGSFDPKGPGELTVVAAVKEADADNPQYEDAMMTCHIVLQPDVAQVGEVDVATPADGKHGVRCHVKVG